MSWTRAAWPANTPARVARALQKAAGAGGAPAAGLATVLIGRRMGAALGLISFGVGPWGGRPLVAATVQALAVGALAKVGGVGGTGARPRPRRTAWALGAAALAPPALAVYALGVAGDTGAGAGLRLFGATLAAGTCLAWLAAAVHRRPALAAPAALCGWGLLLVEIVRWTPPTAAPPAAEAATCAWPAPVVWARDRARGSARAAQALQAWAAARGAEPEVLASLAPLRARRGRIVQAAASVAAADGVAPGASSDHAPANLGATAWGPGGRSADAFARRLRLALAPRRTGVRAPVGTLDVVFVGSAAGPVLRGRGGTALLAWLPAGPECAALALCARGAAGASAQVVYPAEGAGTEPLLGGDAVDLGAGDTTLANTDLADPCGPAAVDLANTGAAASGRTPTPAPRGGDVAGEDVLVCPPGWPRVSFARPAAGPWTVRLRGTWLLADATCVSAASLQKAAP